MSENRDPLGILGAARLVVEAAEHVTLDTQALAAYCRLLAAREQVPGAEWEPGFHYRGDEEQTLAYVFCLDTLNFSFWGDPKWRRPFQGQILDGYWALAAALTEAVTADPALLDPGRLAGLTAAELDRLLGGSPTIPLLAERAANLRELGQWIAGSFRGHFWRVVEAAGRDAIALVRLVVDGLPSYRDEALYRGRVVPFYKRAQILAGDLYGALSGQGWGRLARLDELTAFADYKLPQILRHQGILGYSAGLAEAVDGLHPLPPGSPEEVEIRAGTVWAVELMRRELQALGRALASYQIDWLLWLASQDSGQSKPYHRTRTIYY